MESIARLYLVFIASCGALLGAFMTYMSQRLNREANIDPVLVFHRKLGDKCWTLENVGNGPALNIYIAAKDDRGCWTFIDKSGPGPRYTTFNLPSLAKGNSCRLSFRPLDPASDLPRVRFGHENCKTLVARYGSALDRDLLTTAEEHENKRVILGGLVLTWRLPFFACLSNRFSLPPKGNDCVLRLYDYDLD